MGLQSLHWIESVVIRDFNNNLLEAEFKPQDHILYFRIIVFLSE